MRKIALLSLSLLASCGGGNSYHASYFFQSHQKPLVYLLPMEDQTDSPLAEEASNAFTQAIIQRLEQKKQLEIISSKKQKGQFLVTMQLVKHSPSQQNPSELITSIHLKILDRRFDTPRVILQEVISQSTFLDEPLHREQTLSWDDASFRVSPLGLTYAKISREIAMRIKDYIGLATKG